MFSFSQKLMMPAKISITSTSVTVSSADTVISSAVVAFLLPMSLDSLVGISLDFLSAVTTPL